MAAILPRAPDTGSARSNRNAIIAVTSLIVKAVNFVDAGISAHIITSFQALRKNAP